MLHRSILLGLTWLLCIAAPALAEPVDTQQFGFIREGMPEAQVLARLGPPDTRTVLKRYTVASAYRGTAVAETRERVALIYLGDGRLMTTTIIVDGGVVIAKDKRH
jgi:hypothetical protein